MLLEITDWAWAAGIVDGEGSFFILQRRKGEFVPTVKVAMTHEETIIKLKRIFRASHPIQREKGKNRWKELFCLYVTGAEAFCVTQKLQPFLVTKRQQAELMVEYGEKCYRQRGDNTPISVELQALREIIREELQGLNKRGE